jgi:hypothetical protein
MKRDTIVINKEIIPYTFDILLADELFNLRVDYNVTGDLFTITLFKDGEMICVEPIIYGVPLFKDLFQPDKYPSLNIIPFDESGHCEQVTFDNLSEIVLLIVDNGGDEIE